MISAKMILQTLAIAFWLANAGLIITFNKKESGMVSDFVVNTIIVILIITVCRA